MFELLQVGWSKSCFPYNFERSQAAKKIKPLQLYFVSQTLWVCYVFKVPRDQSQGRSKVKGAETLNYLIYRLICRLV